MPLNISAFGQFIVLLLFIHFPFEVQSLKNSKTMTGEIDGDLLVVHLQKICKTFITLETNEKRMSTQHFEKVYKYVTDSMGTIDNFFKRIFQRQQLAGSYADGIKVGKPNEYDALMILKFPDPSVKKTMPGYVTINIKDGIKKLPNVDADKYKNLIDKDGYLLQDKIFDWLRDLIKKTLENCNYLIKVNNNEYMVQQSQSGPAINLDVTVQKGVDGFKGTFLVDFVGALAFNYKDVWVGDRKPSLAVHTKYWNAIPKPNKSNPHNNKEWICSYADIEREYLHGTQALKQLIRIFKKIRDTNNLTNLKSYYIKVMFLHVRLQQDHKYWNRSVGYLFLEMFNVILAHLKTGELMSVWHQKYNLLGQLTPAQIKDVYNKLKKIKDNIDKNLILKKPEFIRTVILSQQERNLSTNCDDRRDVTVSKQGKDEPAKNCELIMQT